jgi:hypothetical protein
MPRKSGDKKSEIVATRLTPSLKRIVEHEAHSEGVDTSEWLRNLIIQELNRREALPRKFSFGAEILEAEVDEEKSRNIIEKKRREIISRKSKK